MSHSNKSIYDLGKLKVQATGICCQNELVIPLKIRSIWLTVPYNKIQAHKPSSVHQFSDEHNNYKSKKKTILVPIEVCWRWIIVSAQPQDLSKVR